MALKGFFREKDTVLFTFSLPIVILSLLLFALCPLTYMVVRTAPAHVVVAVYAFTPAVVSLVQDGPAGLLFTVPVGVVSTTARRRGGSDRHRRGRSGAEAVTVAAARQPDVVLMDLRMPGGDGVTATAGVLAAAPNAGSSC